MAYFQKYKTVHLSSDIKMDIFHVIYKGTYMKISNTATNCRITLWKRQLQNIIRQLDQLTKPNIEHPFNWADFLHMAHFCVKRIPFTDNVLLINRSCDRFTLDKFSVLSLLEMEYRLFRYCSDIESRYDQLD